MSSVLLVGRNGSGKTAIREALDKLRRAASGRARVSDVYSTSDLNWNSKSRKMGFLLQVELGRSQVDYELELETKEGSSDFGVALEEVRLEGKAVLHRDRTGATGPSLGAGQSSFPIDDRSLALPIVQERSQDQPLSLLRQWLSNMLILAPVPELISGESSRESAELAIDASNFGEWFRGFSLSYPASIGTFIGNLRRAWPDFETVVNTSTGRESKSLDFRFKNMGRESPLVPLGSLSHGERCLAVWAAVMTWADLAEKAVCFWDEPDSHISLDEVGDLVRQTNRGFQDRNQLIATSQNPEAIRMFTRENTLVLRRATHLDSTDPPVRASTMPYDDDLSRSIARGEVFSVP